MPTSIRLDTETKKRLDFLANQTGRTKAYYLREMVERGLEDLEDYYLAAGELERVRKGESKLYSAAEVRAEWDGRLSARRRRASSCGSWTAPPGSL